MPSAIQALVSPHWPTQPTSITSSSSHLPPAMASHTAAGWLQRAFEIWPYLRFQFYPLPSPEPPPSSPPYPIPPETRCACVHSRCGVCFSLCVVISGLTHPPPQPSVLSFPLRYHFGILSVRFRGSLPMLSWFISVLSLQHISNHMTIVCQVHSCSLLFM